MDADPCPAGCPAALITPLARIWDREQVPYRPSPRINTPRSSLLAIRQERVRPRLSTSRVALHVGLAGAVRYRFLLRVERLHLVRGRRLARLPDGPVSAFRRAGIWAPHPPWLPPRGNGIEGRLQLRVQCFGPARLQTSAIRVVLHRTVPGLGTSLGQLPDARFALRDEDDLIQDPNPQCAGGFVFQTRAASVTAPEEGTSGPRWASNLCCA